MSLEWILRELSAPPGSKASPYFLYEPAMRFISRTGYTDDDNGLYLQLFWDSFRCGEYYSSGDLLIHVISKTRRD